MSGVTKYQAAAVAVVLRELLEDRPRYRRRWQRWVQRDRSGISGAGVARVIEDYLIDTGEAAADYFPSRKLKDRVARALTGERISLSTIRLFAAAFGMSEADEGRLLAVYSKQSLVGEGVTGTLLDRRAMVRPQDHRTVSLAERYLVGADRRLAARRTHQTIKAISDRVEIYVFNHEPSATDVDVVHGGKVGRRHEYGDGLVAVEIVLDSPLARNEATALEYRAAFADDTEVSEVRRAAFVKVEHVDFAVQFADQRQPREAWWCAWDDHLAGHIVFEEPVPLVRQAIRKYVPYVEESVVGFRWVW